MADKVKVWFDAEADSLEVQFREAPGFMKTTEHEAVMKARPSQLSDFLAKQKRCSPSAFA
jgi:hypothetical protein